MEKVDFIIRNVKAENQYKGRYAKIFKILNPTESFGDGFYETDDSVGLFEEDYYLTISEESSDEQLDKILKLKGVELVEEIPNLIIQYDWQSPEPEYYIEDQPNIRFKTVKLAKEYGQKMGHPKMFVYNGKKGTHKEYDLSKEKEPKSDKMKSKKKVSKTDQYEKEHYEWYMDIWKDKDVMWLMESYVKSKKFLADKRRRHEGKTIRVYNMRMKAAKDLIKQKSKADAPATKKTTYKVYADGENIKESEKFFSSLKQAKEYMKDNYDRYKKWDASLFTLTKITYETEKDLEMGNTDSESIMTRTTIMDL